MASVCIRGNQLYESRQNTDKSQILLEKGEDAFKKTIKIVPDEAILYTGLAVLYLETNKKPDKVLKLAEKAVALEGSAENYYLLCNAYYKNNDTDKAFSAIRKVIEMSPNNDIYRQMYDKIKKEAAK